MHTQKKKAGQENSAAVIKKLAVQMRFRMKEAAVERRGPEAFLHWLRTDDAKKA